MSNCNDTPFTFSVLSPSLRCDFADHRSGLAKLLNSPEHTSQFAEDDLILLVDALDVWLQVPPNVMARRFLEQDKSILVSAEKNCWPNPRDGVSISLSHSQNYP